MPRFFAATAVVAFLGLLIAYNTFFIVQQTEYALVTQFGNPVAVEKTPGLKIKTPFLQTVEYFDNRLLEYVMPEEVEINASDEKRIRIKAFLRWRIVDPLAFAQATRAAGIGGNRIQTMNLQLSNLLGSSLRQAIGSVPLNALLSPERDQVMGQIRTLVSKQASSAASSEVSGGKGFGIEIADVRIVKADLPPENSAAIFSRMQAERKREANRYRAEGDQEAQGIRAAADRDRTVLLAEAQKNAQIVRGEGDAEASRISADAFGKDPKFFAFYRTMQAYMHALDSKDTTLILSPGNGFLKEFDAPGLESAAPAR